MIGQTMLKEQFDNFKIENLPKSILFVGEKGSGRKTFVYWVSYRLGIPVVAVGNSADDIRALTNVRVDKPHIYLVADIDQLSIAAQNSLLKILEEPPNNIYFMLTASQEDYVLPTIVSRCMLYRMCNYSEQNLYDYAVGKYNISDKEFKSIVGICAYPGDIDLLFSYNVTEFLDYVKLVLDNIAVVSGANSFKIGSKLNLSGDTKNTLKYDLLLFWRAFNCLCMENPDTKKLKAIQITARYYSDLRVKGINKQMAFDNWVLDIRKAWL